MASEELPSLTRKANTVCFCTLLFGYKTAPLLWSAMLARIQQSLLEGHEGQHLVCCGYYRGTCAHGTPSWPWVLTTASALGFKVSLKKGERSRQVSWIGIRMTLRDALILGLPAKYTGELVTVLKRWEGGWHGFVEGAQTSVRQKLRGLQESCQCGSVLKGTAYRAGRHKRFKGRGPPTVTARLRGQIRDVPHQAVGISAALVAYLNSATENPTKKFKLDTKKYPTASVITDASPEGLGAVLLVNNKVTRALKSPVLIGDCGTIEVPAG